MTITYSDGNLLDIHEGIICHQVNHKGIANAGLAKQIKNKYPEFINDYLRVCKQYPFEHVKEHGIVSFCQPGELFWIASIFGQNGFGRDKIYTDYYSLKSGLRTVRKKSIFEKTDVFIPYGIGCGLAGGDWNIVEKIIEDIFKYSNCQVYILKLKN